MSKAMSMSDPKRKTRIDCGDRYRRVFIDTETNEYLKNEAMTWFPFGDLWYDEKCWDNGDGFGHFIITVPDGETGGRYQPGQVFKMYSHW